MGLSSLLWVMVTVVCTGGEEPPSILSLAWLAQAHRVVAADGGLAWLRQLGRKADLWVGDGDSLSGPWEEWAPWYGKAELLDRAKDETDTEAAVRISVQEPGEIWLLGGSGRRMDHWWANLRLVASRPRVTRWLTAYEEAWHLGPQTTLAIPTGTVSIFPLGEGPWQIRSEGLQWPLEPVDFQKWHSLSNMALSGGARLEISSGQFLVLRPLDEGGVS